MRTSWLAIIFAVLLPHAQAMAQTVCADSHVALQVLGSGGPRGDARASAGYVVWIDGVSRIMVDAGGGTFLRFKEAGARVADLDLLAISHFHPDHSAEVPALLWLESGNLKISGPTGSEVYPSVTEYVSGLFGAGGTYRVIGENLTFAPMTIDVSAREPAEVYADDEIRVRGIGVPHGDVPAIGYRIDVGETSIAFASDQNGSDPAFAEFASGVDVLVVHFAITEDASGFITSLHAKPSAWGKMASDADAGTLVLSHLSSLPPSLSDRQKADFAENVGHLRQQYEGPVIVAEDLLCIPLD